MLKKIEDSKIFQLQLMLLQNEKWECFEETQKSEKEISEYLEKVQKEKGIQAMLDVEELIVGHVSNCESQGFINGFRYAMQLKDDCAM